MRHLALIAMFLFAGSASAEQCMTLHNGKTLSQWVSEGKFGPVKDLIHNHCNVNSTSPTDTALQAAIKSSESGALEIVNWVANREGVNLELRDSSDLTPLMLAAKHDKVSAAVILIASGAKINARNNSKETALHHAKTPEMFVVLIDSGADVNARSATRLTPLHVAARHLNEGFIVDRLIDKGAKTTINRFAIMAEGKLTPLMVAARKDKPSAVLQRLIAHGANLEASAFPFPVTATTAMHHAARYGHIDNVRQLIKAGADVNWGVTQAGRVHPMMSAFWGAKTINRTHVIRELIEAGGKMIGSQGNLRPTVTDDHIDADGLRAMLKNTKAYWPIRAHAMGIPLSKANTSGWTKGMLDIDCHEESDNCVVYLDCIDDSGKTSTGSVTISAGISDLLPNWVDRTASIAYRLGLWVDDGWTGKLDCALRSRQKITAQVWLMKTHITSNTVDYIRSDESNRAILQRTHPVGSLIKMALRIRCVGDGDCTNTVLQCRTQAGGTSAGQSVDVGTIDRFETTTLYNYDRGEDDSDIPAGIATCTVKSEDAFLVQMLAYTNDELINNTGVSKEWGL